MSTVELVEAEALTITYGLDLLDHNSVEVELNVAEFIPEGSAVERHVYNTIHGTCRVRISRQLDWGKARVRLWQHLSTTPQSEGATVDRTGAEGTLFRYLGVFMLETPEQVTGETPATFECQGYDLLQAANTEHPTSYVAATGSAPLQNAIDLLTVLGLTVIADPSGLGTLRTSERVWPIGEQTTTLTIANAELDAVNYRAAYADREGRIILEPYQAPSSRAPAWFFDATSPKTTLGLQRRLAADLFGVPNRFVFYMDDPTGGLPTEGVSQFTYTNPSDGPTSIDGRGGRVITRTEALEVATYADLVAKGTEIAENARRVARTLSTTAGPMAELWHFDTVMAKDPDLALNDVKFLATDWSLPFDTTDMTIEGREA